jgi:hypothetical protein
MDICLRELYALDHPANQIAGPTFPMFETLKAEILLLRPTSAEKVLTAWGYMMDIRGRIDALEKGSLERTSYADEELRWLARLAVEAIPAARSALLGEGGRSPKLDMSERVPFPIAREQLHLVPSKSADSRR